ncbi:uncharacterized protein LOC133956255 isoform X2 [Platichthys flesus]|uniref:uncharacterized protein LOC133956255 isoform X2 n=1 Tax=Platichthys flesus TaxID=8260 RepID=UPI002DBC8651|nr:uncharacterized protein LOC133956255 isoform X2 [Platichthys flesus]
MDTLQTYEPPVSKHMERKFAVVQWREGEDCGKLSEVKTDNIRRYDDSKMDLHGNPISTYSAVIEWRHGKKQCGGCPHYRATVKFLSDVPELLKTMKNVFDLAEPPRLQLTTPRLPPQSSPQSRPGSSSADSLLSLPRSSPSSSTSESVIPSSKVEIHPGTGVMVEKLAWAYAVNANSATVFVRHLLTAVFPVEILLVQRLRGVLGPSPPALAAQSTPRSQSSVPKVKWFLLQHPLKTTPQLLSTWK